MIVEPPVARIALRADGAIVVEAAGWDTIELRATGGGWERGADGGERWRVERVEGDGGGFRLVRPRIADEDGARTMRMPAGETAEATGRHLLLEDGRLFRLVERAGRDPRFELLSWEVPGPYLVARRATAGWTIEPEASGGALADLPALVVLMALEILDAEVPGGIGRSTEHAS